MVNGKNTWIQWALCDTIYLAIDFVDLFKVSKMVDNAPEEKPPQQH